MYASFPMLSVQGEEKASVWKWTSGSGLWLVVDS